MVLLQQPLVILQQSFVLNLVVNLFWELFEVYGVVAGNGPWGVIDGGGLIGAYRVQVIDPTGKGVLIESYTLLGVDGYFLLHLPHLRIQ
jgi:hypothetical protein